jgi:ABC-type dipeptide/oligopeptide/nickel transport system permease component
MVFVVGLLIDVAMAAADPRARRTS